MDKTPRAIAEILRLQRDREAVDALMEIIIEAHKKGRIEGSIEVINNTCEICHAYPMTVDCNNANCDY